MGFTDEVESNLGSESWLDERRGENLPGEKPKTGSSMLEKPVWRALCWVRTGKGLTGDVRCIKPSLSHLESGSTGTEVCLACPFWTPES